MKVHQKPFAFAFFQFIFSSLVLSWFRVREGFDGP